MVWHKEHGLTYLITLEVNNMNHNQYMVIIPAMAGAAKPNRIEIYKVREMFEEQTKNRFNAEAVVAVESMRVFLKELKIFHEPIVDREYSVAEYTQVIVAFGEMLDGAKEGIIVDALYNFMDNYNFGTERTELTESVIKLADKYTIALGL